MKFDTPMSALEAQTAAWRMVVSALTKGNRNWILREGSSQNAAVSEIDALYEDRADLASERQRRSELIKLLAKECHDNARLRRVAACAPAPLATPAPAPAPEPANAFALHTQNVAQARHQYSQRYGVGHNARVAAAVLFLLKRVQKLEADAAEPGKQEAAPGGYC